MSHIENRHFGRCYHHHYHYTQISPTTTIFWGKFGSIRCVSCGWTRHEGVARLLLHPPRTVQQYCKKCRCFGVSGDGEVAVQLPILHKRKGSSSRLADFVGRALVPQDRLMFLEAIIAVARECVPPQLPRCGCQVMRFVCQRFCSGIGLTGRESRHDSQSCGSSDVATPSVPVMHCVSLSHNSRLYAFDPPISHSLWLALGAPHTFLVPLITEFAEQGCTNTLCFHVFSHVWFGDTLPIQFGVEAGEADLCMAKRFAPVTST